MLNLISRYALLAVLLVTALPGCGPTPVRIPTPGHAPVSTAQAPTSSGGIDLTPTQASGAPRVSNIYLGSGQLVGPPAAKPEAPAPSTGGGTQLAFSDIDIGQVVALVLGEELHLNS